jgi:periplasmic protein TonB
MSGPVNRLFSLEDYPPEAMANGWQGTVIADLTISATGRARVCRIARSSGYRVLDVKTCEILLLRARFTPAKDSLGRPVEDTLRTPSILWWLGPDQPSTTAPPIVRE